MPRLILSLALTFHLWAFKNWHNFRSFINRLISLLDFSASGCGPVHSLFLDCWQLCSKTFSCLLVCVFLKCCGVQVSACLLLSIIILAPSFYSFPMCFWSQNKIAKGSCHKEPGLGLSDWRALLKLLGHFPFWGSQTLSPSGRYLRAVCYLTLFTRLWVSEGQMEFNS